MKRKVCAALAWMLRVLLLSSIGSGLHGSVGAAEKLPVVASFSIIGDLTQKVGGDLVEVHTLVGAGADAHVYQPTPSDARTLARARLVIVNGLGFEGWIDRLIKSSGYRGQLAVASKGVQPLREAHAESGKGHRHGDDVDPHAWQDLANGGRYVANIAQALAAADPANRATYAANAGRLQEELAALDREARNTFAAVPATQRKVVTSHDAFAYFGRAYGIRFIAPVGVSTDAEPSAGEVAAIIRQIRRDRIPAIFVENISDPRLLERISRESGARIGGTLYSDSLSPPGTPGDSYLGMMRHNIRSLSDALGH
ncbi:metal ABC transporter substrate-binding protein [Accumulibacter sp.]|uniref:metal ABC transporter substrate-binding protein n=1 Tax=Accumulibacter sp. TaxID=2053492 RepID=UPI0025FC5E34|nr:metal ABC transporter substrate-binding protein [Accumulibacter sp.]MCM8613660.1 metal ABC transporter substrate-binding protein [Accumulibacter sp.]MCM8637312.1 metal ABC transporter substrate-binding protein [Accumulibacter sp.]MCM8638204.1 metal ABC transporter substrate-binding protein [Accumulibacter sp.]